MFQQVDGRPKTVIYDRIPLPEVSIEKANNGKTKGEVGEGTQNHISFSSLSDCHNIFETNCTPSCKLVVFIFVCCIWEIWGVGMTEIRGRFLAHWSVALAVVLAAHPFPFLHCAMHFPLCKTDFWLIEVSRWQWCWPAIHSLQTFFSFSPRPNSPHTFVHHKT